MLQCICARLCCVGGAGAAVGNVVVMQQTLNELRELELYKQVGSQVTQQGMRCCVVDVSL
jgi:hypothetical protein